MLLLAAVLPVAAQNMTVTGVVKDSDGVPLAGVSVLVMGTKIGTTTGFDGDYKISVAKGKDFEIQLYRIRDFGCQGRQGKDRPYYEP